MFKKFTSSVWNFLCEVGKARYAADLARNHKYDQAKKVLQGK